MRSMQECKEEIFRRGAEKIKKEKQRKKIATGVGMSLCLCAVVFFGFKSGRIFSGSSFEGEVTQATVFTPTEAVADYGYIGFPEMMDPAGSDMSFGESDWFFYGDGDEKNITVEAYIYGMGACARFYSHMEEESMVLERLEYLRELVDSGTGSPQEVGSDLETVANYFMEFYDDTGKCWEFVLKEHVLTNNNTGKQINLARDQELFLLLYLGIEQ